MKSQSPVHVGSTSEVPEVPQAPPELSGDELITRLAELAAVVASFLHYGILLGKWATRELFGCFLQ